MDLYPAIDIRGGKCVRLYQGDYGQETVYGDDPVAQAQQFADAGAPWIHVVDLDAARTGDPMNREVIGKLAQAVDVPVQTGGGVRSREAAAELIERGVTRVVIGTAALENPELVSEVAAEFQVAVGLDARGRDIAVHGWTEGTGRDLYDVMVEFEQSGAAAFVITEIGRDGTLAGPDIAGLSQALSVTTVPVIASGGVGDLSHLEALAAIEVDGRRISGAIVGKAIYEGTVDLHEAIALTSGDAATNDTSAEGPTS